MTREEIKHFIKVGALFGGKHLIKKSLTDKFNSGARLTDAELQEFIDAMNWLRDQIGKITIKKLQK